MNEQDRAYAKEIQTVIDKHGPGNAEAQAYYAQKAAALPEGKERERCILYLMNLIGVDLGDAFAGWLKIMPDEIVADCKIRLSQHLIEVGILNILNHAGDREEFRKFIALLVSECERRFDDEERLDIKAYNLGDEND